MRVIVVRFHVQIKQDNDKASRQHSGAQYRNNLLWFTQAVETLPFELSLRHLFGIYVVNNNMTAFDYDSWAVTIEYFADGYVSDEDAADINYDELLEKVKSDTAEVSKERLKQGYESIEMIGWASQPYYDVVDKKLH